ncbi:MAG: hypothetical protein Q4D98_04315 [Planctomycetia bacterium]|nr:hypothetical protein [Planctomycetia bacterium]
MKRNRFSEQKILAIAAVALGLFMHAAFAQNVGDLPTSLDTMPAMNATGNAGTLTTRPAGIDPKAQAQRFLQMGREALQAGNLSQAEHWAKQASNLAAVYAPNEDSPERLLADVQRAASAPATGSVPAPVMAGTAPAVGATAAEIAHGNTAVAASPKAIGKRNRTIIEARIALANGDVNRATQLANAAGAMNLPYNPNDDTHQNVLTHIGNFTDTLMKRKQEGETESVRRLMAKSMLEQAQTLLGWGRLDEAAQLATVAGQLNVPYNQYEVQPKDLLARIDNARSRLAAKKSGMAPNPAAVAASLPGANVPTANPAVYDTANDTTRTVQVNSDSASVGYSLLQQAQIALQQGNREQARQILSQAERYRGELSPESARRLSDLQMMVNTPEPSPLVPAPVTAPAPMPMPAVAPTAEQSALFGQLVTELENLSHKARTTRESDPDGTLNMLNEFKTKVEQSSLAESQKEMLLRNLRNRISELETYIADNKADIELQAKNAANNDAVMQGGTDIIARQKRLQELTEQFNTLVREQRFAEAEAIGKKAKELYPEESVAVQLDTMGKMLNRQAMNAQIRDDKENEVVNAFLDVDKASIPFTKDGIEYAKNWNDITKRREKYSKQETRYTEKELDIVKRLATPVQARFENQPLQTVMDTLGQMTGVNIHLAPDGLSEQGVAPSQPVTLNMQSEISLQSALNLILGPLNLDYVIRNEVLMITSKSMKDTDVYSVTYPVADLVIPIPNFQPSSNMGLEGALRSAMAMNQGNTAPWSNAMMAPSVAMANRGGNDPRLDPAALGQMNVPIGGNSGSVGGMQGGGSMGFGTGGAGTAGGAASADFDSLIELIKGTVNTESWDDQGGSGTIKPFPVNLSLVVSQTQEIHEKIANLLEQLRRLQDLQVTIEVRFINLSDRFYEKIGVDFNMNIKTSADSAFNAVTGEVTNSATVGRNSTYSDSPTPTAMDIPFLQGSSVLAAPMFGGYDQTANAGAQLGFAILSDVEAYLFMEAAQSTTRSNILQAPKVTLFNGQQAFVADTSQKPYVISVTPVVGDFAAALQPVIVVLSEGTFMTIQAVVSSDRRYVRLTVVPYFSQIGEVREFTFTGTESSTTDTSSSGNQENPDDNSSNSSSSSSNKSGTSVQLPTFSFVTVTTTVSVPDGGTILLGGIKRLSEGRNEMGVPILNKVPFINRLFKNTGIGRETSSLMMMVTPRIIIQEEEEEQLGVAP